MTETMVMMRTRIKMDRGMKIGLAMMTMMITMRLSMMLVVQTLIIMLQVILSMMMARIMTMLSRCCHISRLDAAGSVHYDPCPHVPFPAVAAKYALGSQLGDYHKFLLNNQITIVRS